MTSYATSPGVMVALNKAQARVAPGKSVIPSIDSDVLLAGCSEIFINHGGENYRLRLTRQNKLILTK